MDCTFQKTKIFFHWTQYSNIWQSFKMNFLALIKLNTTPGEIRIYDIWIHSHNNNIKYTRSFRLCSMCTPQCHMPEPFQKNTRQNLIHFFTQRPHHTHIRSYKPILVTICLNLIWQNNYFFFIYEFFWYLILVRNEK